MSANVDDIDLAIISALQRNPSETNKAIAAQVGMSDVGVANRIRRLVENKVIRPTLFYDVDHLGYRIYCLFEIGVKDRPAKDVAADVGKVEAIQMIAIMMGDPQITALFFARDLDHIETVRRDVCKVRGVHTLTISASMDIKKYMSSYGAFAVLQSDR